MTLWRTAAVGCALLVGASGLAPLRAQDVPAAERERTTYTLRVKAAAAEDQSALADADVLVRAASSELGAGFERRGRTDSEGRLDLADVPFGDFRIVVRAPGRVRAAESIQVEIDCVTYSRTLSVLDGASEVLKVELPEATDVTGRVVSAESGEPVEGLRVSAVPHTYDVPRPSDEDYGWTTTAADGAYVISDVPPRTDLHVVGAGAGWTVAIADGRAGDRLLTELRVSRAATVAGVLRDVDGAPAAAVPVFACLDRDAEFQATPQIRAGSARNEPGADSLRTITDDAGRFTLPHLAAGASYRVWALREDVSASRTVSGIVLTAGARRTVDLRLEPLVECDVILELPDGTILRREPDVFPVGDEYPAWLFAPFEDEAACRLSGAHAGRYRLVFEGYRVLDQELEIEVPALPVAPIRVVVQPGRTLGGVVTDGDGTPLNDVGVVCEPVEAQETASGRTRDYEYAESGADGTFVVEGLADVDYEVRFLDYDKSVFETRRISPPFERLRIVKGAPISATAVRFRLPGGVFESVRDLRVEVRDGRTRRESEWSTYERLAASSDGAVYVEGLVPGPLFVDIDVPGIPPLVVPFTARHAQTVDIGDLAPPESVSIDVRVVDEAGGPVGGVALRPHYREDLGGITDAAGRLHIPAVLPGRVAVMIEAQGYRTQSVRVEAAAHVEPIEIRLVRAGTLHGRVVDADGHPVSMDVFACVPDLLGDGTHQVRARSDAAGRFAVPALPGLWRVQAERDGVCVAFATVVVQEGREAEITVVVPSSE